MMTAQIIEGVLRAIAAAAPGLITAIAQSGAQSDEEAIDIARREAAKLPERTGPRGKWSEDLELRKQRGDKPGSES